MLLVMCLFPNLKARRVITQGVSASAFSKCRVLDP